MFKILLLKLFMYYKGIRFYKTNTIPKSPEFKRAVFRTVNGSMIEFFFYKEVCEDLIFKRGKIKKEKFIGYVIQAKFDEALPEALYKYNNLKFFFNSKSMIVRDEHAVADVLLNIYLDFIKSELSILDKTISDD